MTDNRFEVTGKKLSLRFIEEEDFPLIVKWRNTERVRKNFIYREKFTLEGQKNWKKNFIDTGKVVQMMICENDRDLRPIGSVYFRDIDKDTLSAEYGIFIGEEDASGKGYGNDTVLLAIDYARDVLGLKKLILRVFKHNTPAFKSYEHAGFVKIQDLPMVECSDGEKNDMILMEKSL